MGTGEFNAGGNPEMDWASHPGGSRNTASRFMPQKPELSASLIGPRGPNADFTLSPYLIAFKARARDFKEGQLEQ